MIVYDGLKRDFLQSVDNDTIALEIEENILQKMGRHTVKNEFISWDNSMQYMYKVMNDPEIPEDAGIAIEYNIPPTSKRVDFMISGYDIDGRPGMVIIELKQWSSCPSSGATGQTDIWPGSMTYWRYAAPRITTWKVWTMR